jgi:hypothetical protein
MTPLKIEILLHYYCSPEEYREGDLSAPAVEEAIEWFLDNGLLELADHRDKEKCGGSFRATDRAKALIEAWCNTPLPVSVWVIPERAE